MEKQEWRWNAFWSAYERNTGREGFVRIVNAYNGGTRITIFRLIDPLCGIYASTHSHHFA